MYFDFALRRNTTYPHYAKKTPVTHAIIRFIRDKNMNPANLSAIISEKNDFRPPR
jgi:hypothetical protein